MKRVIYIIIIVCCILPTYAQDIEVKKMELLAKDQTAAISPRKDINGNTCGLLKVALKESGAEFEGNVMGKVEFTGKEYLVYLPNGTKRIGIKHPNYLPTTIVFGNHGIKRIESDKTYLITLKANKKKEKKDSSKKGLAVFNIKPSNAMLIIDGQIADGSGGVYTLSLPYGTHYYTIKIKDFSIINQILTSDKNAKNINIDLTEFFANLNISSKTEDAEIIVNGEQKGVGKWGNMVAPGRYNITISKEGCHSQNRQVELKDNDAAIIDFPELKSITGSLHVETDPIGADVLLNGVKIGVTPLVKKEIPVGKYQIEISKKNYFKIYHNISIEEDHEWVENEKLKITELGQLIEDGGTELAEYYRYGAYFGWRGRPYSPCSEDSFYVSINPVESIRLYRKILSKSCDEEDYDCKSSKETAEEEIGPCYLSEEDDGKVSFCWAMDFMNNYEEKAVKRNYEGRNREQFGYGPYPSLAWHYYYGVGCEKDIEKAKMMMLKACPNGVYYCPAFKDLIEKLGLQSELKYKQYPYPYGREEGEEYENE